MAGHPSPTAPRWKQTGFFAEVASGKMSSKVAVLYVTLISDHCQQGVSYQVDCHKRLVKKKKVQYICIMMQCFSSSLCPVIDRVASSDTFLLLNEEVCLKP